MKQTNKNLLTIFGSISLFAGLMLSIPSYINSNYFSLGGSLALVIIGSILLSIAFGN